MKIDIEQLTKVCAILTSFIAMSGTVIILCITIASVILVYKTEVIRKKLSEPLGLRNSEGTTYNNATECHRAKPGEDCVVMIRFGKNHE